jgi:hypothetical protein
MSMSDKRKPTGLIIFILAVCEFWAGTIYAATAPAYTELPLSGWTPNTRKVAGLEGEFLCAVAYPDKDHFALQFKSEKSYDPGLYRLRLTLSPSDVTDFGAWQGGLAVTCGTGTNDFRGVYFGRVNVPETKTLDFLQLQKGPIEIKLSPYVETDSFEMLKARRDIKNADMQTGPSLELDTKKNAAVAEDNLMDDFKPLSPATHFYYLLHKAEIVCLSKIVAVKKVRLNKVRYMPGETLTGTVTLQNVGRSEAAGSVTLYLERNLTDRKAVKQIPFKLTTDTVTLAFDVTLPQEEFGYALVAACETADGQVSEAADYFAIAASAYRIPIYMCRPGQVSLMDENRIRSTIQDLHDYYINCVEIFFWGEDDMVELSPAGDYWFSGQTCYQVSKKGLQDWIRIAHENGISMSTYGKFIMSGYLGWKTAYDYPNDHKGQYYWMTGMWEATRVKTLDRFLYKEFAGPESPSPGEGMSVSWQDFMPINPDPTPQMVRIAAEEMLRSIEMFGWDAVRWDGHPRGVGMFSGQIGGSGTYDYTVARETQMFVRYFKDIVNEKHPTFGHGYNYLSPQDAPSHAWAVEDYELDELASGNGLLMNEGIKMDCLGKPLEWFAGNVQVEGDLARERGGKLLMITGSDRSTEQDKFLLQLITFAGGACGYSKGDRLINRYATRFSQYCLDETLRRIAKPEAILQPASTNVNLWWTPFVFETAAKDNQKQLVVNLLNLAPKSTIAPNAGSKPGDQYLAPGSDPVDMAVTLPAGHRLKAAHLINPFTLDVQPLEVKKGKISLPALRLWGVLILDLEMHKGVPALAETLGPPKTLGVLRPDLKVNRPPFEFFDLAKSPRELNDAMNKQFPPPQNPFAEAESLQKLDWDARNRAVLAIRGTNSPPPAAKPTAPEFGDLTPVRNGVVDIHYARGAMDYNLQLYNAFAHLARFSVSESLLSGGQKWYSLSPGLSWRQFSKRDLLVFVDIPFVAMGAENTAAMAEYVKAGGAAFFTGGEYAFGKGNYLGTPLDFDLLPVTPTENIDTRYSLDPLVLEPGPDWKELDVKADFGAKPSFWCWNQVAVRENAGVKVFLKAGNRPVLVGWTLGRGRVACLLAQHRGRSVPEQGQTAFFDWKDWPGVETAVLRWLTPDALKNEKPPVAATLAGKDLEKAIDDMKGTEMEDLIDSATGGDDAIANPAGPGAAEEKELSPKELANLLEQMRKFRGVPDSRATELVVRQIARVANLSDAERWSQLDAIRATPPPNLEENGKRSIKSLEPGLRGVGFHMLAMAGSPVFAEIMRTTPVPGAASGADILNNRYLALALCFYNNTDLKALGERRLTEWQDKEARAKKRYTGDQDFSLAAPEVPLLDSQTLLLRIGWLAYMARMDPVKWAPALAREWTMTVQYADYCDREVQNIQHGMMYMVAPRDIRIAEQNIRLTIAFRGYFTRLDEVLRPQVTELCRTHPLKVAEGFQHSAFRAQAQHVIDFLGPLSPEESKDMLLVLKDCRQPLIAEFAAVRLNAAK